MDREAPLAAIAGCRRCSLARKSSKIKALAGMFGLPDARNKTFRPCHVRSVFVAKLLEHHPLLRADSKREEDSKCDHVRRTCHPIRDDERVGNGPLPSLVQEVPCSIDPGHREAPLCKSDGTSARTTAQIESRFSHRLMMPLRQRIAGGYATPGVLCKDTGVLRRRCRQCADGLQSAFTAPSSRVPSQSARAKQ